MRAFSPFAVALISALIFFAVLSNIVGQDQRVLGMLENEFGAIMDAFTHVETSI